MLKKHERERRKKFGNGNLIRDCDDICGIFIETPSTSATIMSVWHISRMYYHKAAAHALKSFPNKHTKNEKKRKVSFCNNNKKLLNIINHHRNEPFITLFLSCLST